MVFNLGSSNLQVKNNIAKQSKKMIYFCSMLSSEEEHFYEFWEKNREAYSTTSSKLRRGLPFACLFGLPILFLLFVVYFFFPHFYYQISKTSTESYIVVAIAVFIFILFYAYIKKHFQWEMNEQEFKQMKQIKEKSKAAKNE